MIQCEVLTDFGQTVEDNSEQSDTEPREGTVLRTGSGETIEDSSGYSDRKSTACSV